MKTIRFRRSGATSADNSRHITAASAAPNRNLLVQILVVALISGVGVGILPWPAVLAWGIVALVVAGAEDRLFQFTERTVFHGGANILAPALRAVATSIYAVAAFALLGSGEPGAELFAFTIVACSMVYVLMRYYRSPFLFLVSISPFLIILTFMGAEQVRQALSGGRAFPAIASTCTIAMFGVLFWAARAQFAARSEELIGARENAEARERAAAAANRAKSRFLAMMSHELRTPLNAVLGMAQALAADELTQVQRERVKVIRRSSHNLLAVLNDLLDLSNVEASSLKLEVAEFDLMHLVRGTAAAFEPAASKKGLSFELELAMEASGRYLGDAARVRRILYSLCDNAVKFTQTGRITLSVNRERGSLVFRVSDTGVGVPPEAMAHLFEDFFQADASPTRRFGGAGLGLALCRSLADLMGGTIEAASEAGRGSTFTVRLPLEAVEPTRAPEDEISCSIETERLKDLRVLAAEDNPTNQLVLATLLAQIGFTPKFANDGREALAAWEAQDWDIILMDIQMPEMDGVAATRAIRLREAETGRRRTPVLAVTANSMAHQIIEYEAAGMDAVVAKPIEVTRLFAAIEDALDGAAKSHNQPLSA